MANEIFKEIKTRIALKQNTYSYWSDITGGEPAEKKAGAGEKAYYVPLYGEVCFCEITTTNGNNQTTTTPPTVLFKVGNGTDYFKDLKWASALAADVYDWAKVAGLFVNTTGSGNALTSAEWDSTLNNGKGGLKFTKGETFVTKEELEELREGLEADTNTRYQFSIPTSGDDKGKLLVEKKEIGESTWTRVNAYDFVTPGELTETLKGYYTKSEVDDLIQGVRDDIPTELGVMSVELLPGTENGSLKLKVNGEEGEDVPVTGLEKIKVENAVHADAAGQVDKTFTVKVGGVTKQYDGSADVEADVDAAIEAAIDEIPAAPVYSLKKAADSGAYAAVYHLTKDGENIGDEINIPKDMVVEKGYVEENPAGQPAGTYIVLKLQNVTNPLYINVGSLIEYVTSGSKADDAVVVAVDNDHKVTATLTDGKITLAKLEKDVQDAIALAKTALQAADITGKADKVTGAVAGNFAGLDADGNLTDSGINAEDLWDKQENLVNFNANWNVNEDGIMSSSIEESRIIIGDIANYTDLRADGLNVVGYNGEKAAYYRAGGIYKEGQVEGWEGTLSFPDGSGTLAVETEELNALRDSIVPADYSTIATGGWAFGTNLAIG